MSADCIQAEDISGAFPLSPTQAGMLFHSLFAPSAGIYLEQIIWRLDGEVDVPAFANAWQRVVDHHEILRTSFSWEGLERPLQIVQHHVALPFRQHDWRELSQLEQESRLESFVHADREAGFNFSQPPLMRVALIRLAEDSYRLVLTNHHALLDGWSQSLVLKQVFSVYRALAAGEEPSLEPSPSYHDYIDWLAAQDSSEAERFWKQALKGFTAPTSLGVDRFTAESHSEVATHEEMELRLSVETTAELQAFARKHRLTMFTLVQGAWALLLGRYSGSEDVAFGTTVTVRPHELPDIDSAAGLFINTIPVRARLSSDTDLLSWLKELQLETVEAREHQHSSLSDVQRWSEVPKGSPLFESILVFENYPTDGPGNLGPGTDVQQIQTIVSRTNYPLTLLAFPGAELQLNAIYDSVRFDGEATARMLGHLETILMEVVANPTRKLAELPLLTTFERKQLLVEWNQTETEYETDQCFYHLFERQAAGTPDAIAVVFENQQLTYADLNTRANRLAHHLRGLGVGPESLVGICVERSLEMVVGLLGILKAGGAYVPLDPAFPKDRLAFMIEDANVPVLLTQQKLVFDLPPHQAKVVSLDSDWDLIERESAENPVGGSTSDNLAYVIYTSGSTGKPKGVQIGHRALTNFLCSVRREPGLSADDVLLSVTTLSFDIAALELYLPLIVGARLVVVSREVAADGNQLKERIGKSSATVIQATPARWKMLIDAGWQGSRQLKVLCGGEALSRELADQLRQRSGSLWNMYGPTETTIWSTVGKVECVDGPISIGRPMANTKVYLLDNDLNPAPIGIAGELHIGGDGLARGYLNRPELTGEKFIRNPFSSDARARLYKTGDLARYLADGRIDCLGRIDDQVKIRGFRIELGEIESVLRAIASVSETVVVAREDVPGDGRLVAYIVPSDGVKVDQKQLRAFLREKLPDYMIPATVVELAELPLTPNGKVNRRALPVPDYCAQLDESYVAPRTPVEELLSGIWAEVLKVSRVGVNDNFFELGGHSLLATQVVSRVLQTFGAQLPLRALFEAPTVATMAERIERSREDTPVLTTLPLTRTARNGAAPLSFGQQSFWFLDSLTPNTSLTSLYHTPTAVRLTGSLDVAALKKALDAIVARHDALRTTFAAVDGTPTQVVARSVLLDVPLIELTTLTESDREAESQRVLRDEARRPFDLSQGPLIRAVLLRLQEQEHILLVTMHHIVTDGWSIGIFHRELSVLYQAFTKGQPSPLAELPIQYVDYADWQRRWFEGDVYRSQLAYWKKQFATLPPVLELPTDHSRPNVQAYRAFRGAHHTICLSKQLTKDLKQLCQKENVTLFMLLMAAYQILLHRYTGEEDIVVGTPIAGRHMPETEDLIGLFINTLAMRTNVSGELPFRELLKRVKEVALEAYAHQDLPFERLVKELQPERTLAHNPLFQVMFVLQSEEILPLQLSGLVAQHFRIDHVMANFDLTLDIVEREEQLVCLFESNADLFESDTIERMLGHLQILLEGAVANPDQTISGLPLLSESERRQLLVEWNDTKTEYPAHKCIQELFEQQVNDRPDAVALVFEDRRMTYRELNKRANQLAHYLRRRAIQPDTRVAICLERSPEMIVTLLAILKAGGAYVPLDPAYPQARLQLMLEDARARVLLTQTSLLPGLPRNTAEVICLDELREEIARESQQNPPIETTANNLAYVMYTSGSTGKPKGVAVTHRNVVRLVKDTNYASFSSDEVFLQGATISFDASTFEIWGSLLNGARLALLPAGVPSLTELGQALKNYHVTTLWLTAGLFHLMVDNHLDDLRGVRQLLAGGDVLSVPHVRKVFEELPDCRLINGYGPTENTTFTCCYPVTDLTKINGSVPIGYPISNTSVFVLDRHLNPAPIGVAGELYIGGDGLASGYLDRPELNAERFVRDPFSTEPNARLYRTGDLVRYRATGEIEFIGRIDNQVKVRGFRIELGEIEAALGEHSAVREAVVVARKDEGDKHLVAYLTTGEGNEIVVDDLRDFLQQKLPDHMVPSVFVVLESLPLTPIGKVDRRALPLTNGFKPKAAKQFSAAGDELELKLTRIWEKVLNVRPVGADDNFFELGGHSLLAVRLFAQIEKSFGKNLPLATLFQAPTVKQLARVLRQEGWRAAWSSLVMIQGGGKRQPFFCVHAAGGNVLEYRDLARLLGPDQPFYGLQAKGLDGKEEPHTSIKEMAAHYLKEMREVQPEGPYLIGGRSSGGTIAYEMACRLAAEGQEVALLALLDTFPAGYFKLLPGSGSWLKRAGRYGRKLESHAVNLRQLEVMEKIAYVFRKLKYAPAKTKHKLYSRAYKIYQRYGRPLPPVLKNIEAINFAAVKDYEPQTYSGNVTLFLASDLTADYDLHDGWRELVRGHIEAHEIPGNHINIIKEPHVRALAEKLSECVRRAERSSIDKPFSGGLTPAEPRCSATKN